MSWINRLLFLLLLFLLPLSAVEGAEKKVPDQHLKDTKEAQQTSTNTLKNDYKAAKSADYHFNPNSSQMTQNNYNQQIILLNLHSTMSAKSHALKEHIKVLNKAEEKEEKTK